MIVSFKKTITGISTFVVLIVGLAWSPATADSVQLALKDVACVQQCNNTIRTCRTGCDEGFRVCMERKGKSNPCSQEKQACNAGCTQGHNACVARCPEK
ncbi:MAG: hypothetical protein RIB80_11640 [Rhodospirillales bacterium]